MLKLTLLLFITISISAQTKTAVFAGGCFWCMEPPFDKLDGVKETISGYSDGKLISPSYKQVASGSTKHIEAVKVTYDSSKISYEKLLEVFWRQINPTDGGGQFVDRGYQYSSAIFYQTDKEKRIALESKKRIRKYFDRDILTRVTKLKNFYPAENYHQDYYKKNPIRYKFYRYNSGRDKFLNSVWNK